MMARFLSLILVSLVTTTVSADVNAPACIVDNETDVTLNQLPKGPAEMPPAILHIQGKVAGELYHSMVDVKEFASQDEGPATSKREGKNLFCLKQDMGDCALYQCQIVYQDIAKGKMVPSFRP